MVEVFGEARLAWAEILRAPGLVHLVVTHKCVHGGRLCVEGGCVWCAALSLTPLSA